MAYSSQANSSHSALDAITVLKQEVQKSIIGQDYVVERLIFSLLANGNVLLEGLPGLAKTRAVKRKVSQKSSRPA